MPKNVPVTASAPSSGAPITPSSIEAIHRHQQMLMQQQLQNNAHSQVSLFF